MSITNSSIIDKLQIQFSGKCFQASLAADQAKLMDGVNLTLRQAGWTLTGATYATANFFFVLGAPVTHTAPILIKTIARCSPNPFLRIGQANFTLYDPNTTYPDPSAQCVMVPMGDHVSGGGTGTLDNLAALIPGATQFLAALTLITVPATPGPGNVSYYRLTITGKFTGPDLNFVPINVDGAYGVRGSDTTLGGGWTLLSVGTAQTSPFAVTMAAVANSATDNGPAVAFSFNLNGQTGPRYLIDMVAVIPPAINGFTIICNPYSFAIFDGSDDNSFPFGLRQASIAAFAPYVPVEEGFQPCYCVFILGPHNLRTGTIWGYGPNNWKGPITTCLDSLPATYNNFPACPRCLSFRQPGTQPLLTPDGQPLITTAWIMMGGDPWSNKNATPAIVGRLWDCAIVSDVTTGLNIAGQNFVKLGSQDGSNGLTRSTLVMCNGTAPPPDPNGPPAGTTLGIVKVNGTSVFWVRGQTFNPAGIGLQIYLGFDSQGPFTVQYVAPDGHSMIISPAPNISGTVPWHT